LQNLTILNYSKRALWLAAILFPFVAFWASQVQFGTVLVESWLPWSDTSRTTYRDYLSQFGEDRFLFATWPNCNFQDPRLEDFDQALGQIASRHPEMAVESVTSSREIIEQLADSPAEISLGEAIQRLRGIAIGADGSCFVAVRVGDADYTNRRKLIAAMGEAADSVSGLSSDELILAGEPYQVYVIDQASRQTFQYFVVPSSLLALGFAWYCLLDVRLTVLIFTLAGMGQLLGLALIGFFLGQMSAVLVVLPTLIFMLTLSAAIHLVNYYQDAGGQNKATASAEALRHGMRPCVLATLTTVFGFGSLFVSRLSPVWQFGGMAALGLATATIVLLFVFPAYITLGASWSARRSSNRIRRRDSDLSWLVSLTCRHCNAITLGGLALLAITFMGLPRLKTSTEFIDMFGSTSPAIESLRWVEQHLGPIDSLEFVISFPTEVSQTPDTLQQITLLERVHRGLAESPHTASVLSAVTFLPEIPSGGGTRNTIRRAVWRRTLDDKLSFLNEQQLVYSDADIRRWRLSAKIFDLTSANYFDIHGELVQLANDLLHSGLQEQASDSGWSMRPSVQQSTWPAGMLEVTGLRTVIEKAHFALLSDLAISFITAFALITPVMMLIARGVIRGMILMIPNLLPVLFVFGTMGWLGVKVDVASILTASVALGIAVDDTLHFVNWFTRFRDERLSTGESVERAIHICARPMLYTTAISAGAMLPFLFSDFLPTSKFALLMILILSAAVIGDLVLLPAILQSPLGRLVYRQKCEQ
jgi:predicted RND superfamily exporter protein